MSEGAAALSAVETVQPSDNGAVASNESGSWFSGFDEDTQAYINHKGWDSPSKLLESYRNLEKFAGGSKNLVELPGDDADEDTLGSFYDRLGRPESPDKYGLQLPEGGDEQLMDWFQQTAHRYGLSDKQTKAMFNEWNEMSNSRVEAMQYESKVQAENDINDLKREYGSEFDNFLNSGKRAASALGYDEQSLSALEERMGTGEMMRLFSKLGERMGEDSYVDGDTSDAGFGTSPARARAEIAELKLDKGFMDRYLSGDKDALNKMQRLMGIAYE